MELYGTYQKNSGVYQFFLVLGYHGVYMYVVYIWKWSSAHALGGGVSGVTSFITTDEQLQSNRGCCFLVQAMLPEGFPFHQIFYTLGMGWTAMCDGRSSIFTYTKS